MLSGGRAGLLGLGACLVGGGGMRATTVHRMAPSRAVWPPVPKHKPRVPGETPVDTALLAAQGGIRMNIDPPRSTLCLSEAAATKDFLH